MSAARLRLGALLLAVLVGSSGLAGAGRDGADHAPGGDPVHVVVEVVGIADAAAVAHGGSNAVRTVVRHDVAPLAVLGAVVAALVVAAVVTVGGGTPAVPSGATAHVRRRGPPSCA